MNFSFIHTADIHLGRAFADISHELSTSQKEVLKTAHEAALETICNFAIERDVDFILIAGDTFDACEHDLHSKIVLTSILKRLENNNINVYIVCGNHDPATSYTNELAFKNSDKIHIFGVNTSCEPTIINHNGKDIVCLYPFGFNTNEYKNNPCKELKKANSNDLFNIGLIHCDIMGDNNTYAPCSEKELLELNYDYYALGHIHKPYENGKIVYSGTPQSRSRKDEGAHGFRYVSVNNNQIISNEFITCDKIRFCNIDYSLTGDSTAIETIEKLQEQLYQYKSAIKLSIINLTLNGICGYKKPKLEEIRNELSGENVIINEITDNSSIEVDIEQISSSGGVLSHIINNTRNSEKLKTLLDKTSNDISEVLKLTDSIKQEVISAPAISIAENICREIYGKEVENE